MQCVGLHLFCGGLVCCMQCGVVGVCTVVWSICCSVIYVVLCMQCGVVCVCSVVWLVYAVLCAVCDVLLVLWWGLVWCSVYSVVGCRGCAVDWWVFAVWCAHMLCAVVWCWSFIVVVA